MQDFLSSIRAFSDEDRVPNLTPSTISRHTSILKQARLAASEDEYMYCNKSRNAKLIN